MLREEIQRGWKEDKRFEVEGGGRATLAEGAKWSKLNSGGIEAGGVQRGRHSVGRCWISRRSMEDRFGTELSSVLNLEKESSELLK